MLNSHASAPLKPLLSVADLQALLSQDSSEVVVFDASAPPVVPGYESLNSHVPEADWRIIPGARRFDFDTRLCDPDATLPHMMPSAALFEKEVRSLGLNTHSLVVIYDDVGVYASPRGWWMLKAMGHDNVAVLDGGLRAWIDAGNPTEVGGAQWRAGKKASGDDYTEGDYVAIPRLDAFVDSAAVATALTDSNCRVLDARSTARFNAEAPEPRPSVRGGHMPVTEFSFPDRAKRRKNEVGARARVDAGSHCTAKSESGDQLRLGSHCLCRHFRCVARGLHASFCLRWLMGRLGGGSGSAGCCGS